MGACTSSPEMKHRETVNVNDGATIRPSSIHLAESSRSVQPPSPTTDSSEPLSDPISEQDTKNSAEIFTESESISFILKELKLKDSSKNRADSQTLSNLLGRHKLGIQLVVLFIKCETSQRSTLAIKDYIIKFKDHSSRLKFRCNDFPFIIIYTICSITLAKLEKLVDGVIFIKLISILSLLQPEPGNVPTKLLFDLVSGNNYGRRLLENCLDVLKTHGLISQKKMFSLYSVSMNPQIQNVILKYLQTNKKLNSLLRSLSLKIVDFLESVTITDAMLPSYLRHLWSLTDKYELVDPSEQFYDIKWRIANRFSLIGSHEQALVMLNETENELELKKSFPGKKTVWLNTRILVGEVLVKKGNYQEGLDVIENMLVFFKDILESDEVKTTRIKHSMADALFNLERYDEAETVYRMICKVHESLVGTAASPTLIPPYLKLAFVLQKQCKYEQALGVYIRLLKISKEKLGEGNPVTLILLHYIGTVHEDQGQLEQALELYVKVIEMRKETLELDHPDTLRTLQRIGSVLRSQGKVEGALKMEKECNEMSRKIKEGKTKILSLEDNIKMELEKYEEKEENEMVFEMALQLRQAVFGKVDDETKALMYKTAFDPQAKKDSDRAADILFDMFENSE